MRDSRSWLKPVVACAVVVLMTSSGCRSSEPDRPPTAATPEPRITGPSERGRTIPRGPRVDNVAPGEARRFLEVAIEDLRQVGLWRPLTEHLYAMQVDARLAIEDVPDDGHLADAYSTGLVEEDGAGAYCDLMFWPIAIEGDLLRWEGFWAEGLIERRPPTLRQYWAALLAHELAHCLNGRHGEKVAQEWEERTIARLRRSQAKT